MTDHSQSVSPGDRVRHEFYGSGVYVKPDPAGNPKCGVVLFVACPPMVLRLDELEVVHV